MWVKAYACNRSVPGFSSFLIRGGQLWIISGGRSAVTAGAATLGGRLGCHPAHGVTARASPRMVFIGGPEIWAPVSLPGWLGTTTATATLGSLAGAKAIIQSLVSVALGPVSAVPVLAATFQMAGNPTPAAVPRVTTACIRVVTAAAVSGLVAVSQGLGAYDETRLPWVSRICSITWGVMFTPWLAMPSATSAICRVVATTSCWPKAE